ncbi:MAG: DUF885 family protein [Pseudomonadota bacterium]
MQRLPALCITLAAMLYASPAASEAGSTTAKNALALIASDYATAIKDHAPPPIQLSVADMLGKLESPEALAAQHRTFKKLAERLTKIKDSTLTTCERIDHAVLLHETRALATRAELGQRYREGTAEIETDATPATLRDIPDAGQWYRYRLTRWLGDDLTTDELFKFGESALKQSVADFDALDTTTKTTREFIDGGESTEALFSDRQATVWKNVDRYFPITPKITKAHIARANLPDFPAPGYYDAANTTFFYNVPEDGYDPNEADWLFLHEATPGHHYQSQFAQHHTVCNPLVERPFNPTYAEGWAAYVETLGGTLGLYKTAGARRAAIEWDMVRSVRVVLDIGLNAYGWSDADAHDYWHEHVRGQRDIAEREIKRLRLWPAQAITYKHGAAVFSSLQQRFLATHDQQDALKGFHLWALQHGPVPMATLKRLAADWP